jgi:hypothetical protein
MPLDFHTRRQVVHLLQSSSLPPHQLARPASGTGHEDGSGSNPGDGVGPAGGAYRTHSPKVLAAGIVRVPRDVACWTATSALFYAASHRAAKTPPTVAALPPLTQKLESSPPAPLYNWRLRFVAGLVIYK